VFEGERIIPPMRVDLVLVNGDPTTNIKAARDSVAVWKTGVPVDRQAWLERTESEQRTRAKP
jgi:hypothetical protein